MQRLEEFPFKIEGLWCLTPLFNTVSVISWRSVLLVEEIEVPRKTTNLPQVTDKHYHIML
jgi:hypothetical protein